TYRRERRVANERGELWIRRRRGRDPKPTVLRVDPRGRGVFRSHSDCTERSPGALAMRRRTWRRRYRARECSKRFTSRELFPLNDPPLSIEHGKNAVHRTKIRVRMPGIVRNV